jgi:hypothetical protein
MSSSCQGSACHELIAVPFLWRWTASSSSSTAGAPASPAATVTTGWVWTGCITGLCASAREPGSAWSGLSGRSCMWSPKLSGGNLGVLQMVDYASGLDALKRIEGNRDLGAGGASMLDLVCVLLVEASQAVLRQGLSSARIHSGSRRGTQPVGRRGPLSGRTATGLSPRPSRCPSTVAWPRGRRPLRRSSWPGWNVPVGGARRCSGPPQLGRGGYRWPARPLQQPLLGSLGLLAVWGEHGEVYGGRQVPRT